MHKCHESEVGIEPTFLEVKGPCSDDCNLNIKFLVRLHGEYSTSLALWKHHVNLLSQSFQSVRLDLHQCYYH